jgi:ABC-type transport system substrate-binding protein
MIMRKCGRRFLTAFLILLTTVALSCGPRMPGIGMYDEGGTGPVVTPEGVEFTYIDPDASRVNLVGDFNNWSATADPLYDREGTGRWTIRIPLKPGRYQYKFLVDGKKWQPDLSNPHEVDDGFGGLNSVIEVE